MKYNNLNISDIHKIRYDNFRKTEKMSAEELISYTKNNAEKIKLRLKKEKIKV